MPCFWGLIPGVATLRVMWRGSESGEVRLQRASCEARLFIDERRPFPVGTRAVLLHTRFATQGDPSFPENNHPVYAGAFYAVDNGHVSNDAQLIRESGIQRLGRVDSEAIPAIVRHYGWNRAGDALASVEGAAAVALMDGESGALILARGYQSPLILVDTPTMLVWASTFQAIETAWKQTLGTVPGKERFEALREGDIVHIGADGARRGERFEPYAPAYSFLAYEAYTAPKQASGGVLGTVTNWLLGSEEEEEETSGITAGLEQCDDCGDWFPRGELWEIFRGLRLCMTCERHYYDVADEARGWKVPACEIEAPAVPLALAPAVAAATGKGRTRRKGGKRSSL